MALAEINYLRVIYALLLSDWLALNLELEPRNPGKSTQTYFSFPSPAHFRTYMRICGKIRLVAILVCVRVCVPACVCLCVRPLVWACVRVFNCMCVLSYVC